MTDANAKPPEPQLSPEAPPPTPASSPTMHPKVMEALLTIPPHFSPQAVQIVSGLWAMSLLFLSTKSVPTLQGVMNIEVPEVDINLSYPVAKALCSMLEDAIKQYEETQGPVNMPKLFIDRKAETSAKP